ncbi:MAG: tetratricopeptide repeat protein [Deltaproteobacteria bacterium]|nr:tetratricopeptide repeat protein [Deltaproteobacteria bacterium]
MRAHKWMAVLAIMAGFGGAAACAPSKPADSADALRYSENARNAYEKALQAYLDRDWEAATELFKEVKRKYGQSRWGKMAELRLADVAFEQEKLAEAIGAYKGYVQGHRNDPDLAYAQYRICRALFLQVSDSVLLPPQEERDQANVREAYVELRRFLREHPQSKWTNEVAYMQEAVTGRIVRHELYVARFYLNVGNFEAAVARAQYALRNFDGSGLEPEAMVLLGETYLKMKKNTEARETFNRVLTMYPESPFSVPARSFLNEMTAARR